MDPLQQAFDTWLAGIRNQGLAFAALYNLRIKTAYNNAYGTWKNILFQMSDHDIKPPKPQAVHLKNFNVDAYVQDVSTGIVKSFESYLSDGDVYEIADEPEPAPPSKFVGDPIIGTDPVQYGITSQFVDMPNNFPVAQDGKTYIFHRKATPFGVQKYFTEKQ